MTEIKKQEKYGFSVRKNAKSQGHDGTYGPFDTVEAASKTRSALVSAGLTVTDVQVIWTVATARSIATALAPKQEKAETAAA